MTAAVPAGDVVWKSVYDTTVKSPAPRGVAPKATDAASLRFFPVIVTGVPPADGPVFGHTTATRGLLPNSDVAGTAKIICWLKPSIHKKHSERLVSSNHTRATPRMSPMGRSRHPWMSRRILPRHPPRP